MKLFSLLILIFIFIEARAQTTANAKEKQEKSFWENDKNKAGIREEQRKNENHTRISWEDSFMSISSIAGNGFFTIEFEKMPTKNFAITVYNITGKKVIDKSFSPSPDQIHISISEEQEGIYFLKIRNGEDEKTVRLIHSK